MVASPPSLHHDLSERLPNRTPRYDDRKTALAKVAIVPAGPINGQTSVDVISFAQKSNNGPADSVLDDDAAGDSVPAEWTKCVNPAEGSIYFRHTDLRLVTEAFIQLPWILERLMRWYHIVAPFLQSLNTTFELFLQVEDERNEDLGRCLYYLVNYDTHSVFWLRDVSSSALGLPDLRNLDHLKHVLEEQFWIHAEYMPCCDIALGATANTLLSSLATLSIDASTSAGSVSPFSPDECRRYAEELKQVLGTGVSVEINWCIARTMSLLVQSRVVNSYGEPGARTDRATVVNGQHPPLLTITFRALSVALFNGPRLYLSRWNAIWIDRVIYTREWRRVVKEMCEEWQFSVTMGALLSILGVAFSATAVSDSVKQVTLFSAILAIIGFIYGLALIMQYRTLGCFAADGASFIQIQESASHGLQMLALKCSVPGALVTWSAVILMFSITWTVFPNLVSFVDILPSGSRHAIIPILLFAAYKNGFLAD